MSPKKICNLAAWALVLFGAYVIGSPQTRWFLNVLYGVGLLLGMIIWTEILWMKK